MAQFNLTEFQASLLPASYNGIFFFVEDATVKGGQRVAEHQYPFRDIPYSEPLGRQARQYNFTGFIVGDAGVLQVQYAAFLAAIEQDGPGTLIHPVFGALQVICVGAEFEQNVAGRYVEARLQFIEAGQTIYPSTGADTQAATINQAATAQSTSSTSFNNNVGAGGDLASADSMNPNFSAGVNAAQTPAAGAYNEAGDAAVISDTTGFEGLA